MGIASPGVAARHLTPALHRATALLIVRGEGPHVFDAGGRRSLGFTSGIGVTNTRPCHPRGSPR